MELEMGVILMSWPLQLVNPVFFWVFFATFCDQRTAVGEDKAQPA